MLDAGVVIALLDAHDTHHAQARALFTAYADEPLTMGPINQAEVLVRAAREGRDEQMVADLTALGISITALPDDCGVRLARLRAQTRAKMPDCCVLLTALQSGASVSTFDARLADVATDLGLTVLR